jgi:ketosteroid isomerase-like protein
VLVSLPDEQHEARLGSKGGGDVGERGGRIGEEHRPEAADRHVEASGVEAMHLGVAQLVADVVEPFGPRHLTGALEHALGHVDADNTARRRGTRRLASRQPGSAPDVDHLVTGADPVGRAKVLVVGAQLAVVEVQAVRRGHRRDANSPGQRAAMRDTGNAVSQENVELVRRLYAELASEGSTQEFEQRMSDDALGRFLDPEVEWVPVTESLLAVDSYRGFDGVRRFWGEFLSALERYRVETLRFDDAGDQVAVVMHIVGLTHEPEVDETRSSLLTVRDGRVVRVESFAEPDGARQAAGLPP